MANLDAPNGFTPSYHRNGGLVRYDGGFTIASALASDIFLGDVVILTGTDTNIDVGAAASTRILGVFAGCQYTAANGDVVWAKQWVDGTVTLGSVAAEAFVYTDPGIVYTAQADGILATTDIGDFADTVQTHAGNAATGVSGMELNATSAAATILQFRILRLAPQPDGIFESDIATANPRVECTIAEGVYYVHDA